MSRKYHKDEDLKVLSGKKVLSVEWDDKTLKFVLKGEVITFAAVGDCCSKSYIESLDNPEIFENATFISAYSVTGESKDGGEFIHKWTFYKFKTTKGMCTLSFRNESNGYYDGWLHLRE